uniref:LisH domain-containing protein n=1 Tax=Macrostomum lignano TaxID=282301 RepID=A0A1I8J152_9PLAT
SSGHGSHSSSSANRRLAKEIIQSVKSSGLFDELRRDCAAKLESRSGYSRLINQLKPLTKKHLDRVVWEPGLNKVATRERLRRRLLDTPAVQSMLDDLLDQLLSHNAVQTSIQPRVDRAIADYAGVTPEELRQMRRQLPLLPTPNEQQQQQQQ